jgi:hypothetical protein
MFNVTINMNLHFILKASFSTCYCGICCNPKQWLLARKFSKCEYSPKWPFSEIRETRQTGDIRRAVLRVLARLANIRQAVLRGLARLADIPQAVLLL